MTPDRLRSIAGLCSQLGGKFTLVSARLASAASEATSAAMVSEEIARQFVLAADEAAAPTPTPTPTPTPEPTPVPTPTPSPTVLWKGDVYPGQWSQYKEGTVTTDMTKPAGWYIANGQYVGWTRAQGSGDVQRQYPIGYVDLPLPVMFSYYFKLDYSTAAMKDTDWIQLLTFTDDISWGNVFTISVTGRQRPGTLLLYHTDQQVDGPAINSGVWYAMDVKLTSAGSGGDWNVSAQLKSQLGTLIGAPMVARYSKATSTVLRRFHMGLYAPSSVYPCELRETGHQIVKL